MDKYLILFRPRLKHRKKLKDEYRIMDYAFKLSNPSLYSPWEYDTFDTTFRPKKLFLGLFLLILVCGFLAVVGYNTAVNDAVRGIAFTETQQLVPLGDLSPLSQTYIRVLLKSLF